MLGRGIRLSDQECTTIRSRAVQELRLLMIECVKVEQGLNELPMRTATGTVTLCAVTLYADRQSAFRNGFLLIVCNLKLQCWCSRRCHSAVARSAVGPITCVAPFLGTPGAGAGTGALGLICAFPLSAYAPNRRCDCDCDITGRQNFASPTRNQGDPQQLGAKPPHPPK